MELLRSINACHKGNYKDIPIIIKKAVTVCDVLTLDRAVRKNVVSVVYFVQRIDPAETDADSETAGHSPSLLRSPCPFISPEKTVPPLSPTPLFLPGSVVRVLADNSP